MDTQTIDQAPSELALHRVLWLLKFLRGVVLHVFLALGATLALATTADDRTIDVAPYSPVYGRVEESIVLRTAVHAAEPALMAAFVPAGPVGRRPPSLAVVAKDNAAGDGWTRWTLALAFADHESRITLAFPTDPETQPVEARWPQPCIHERRPTCVE